jgi:hypothetical protein
MTDLLEPWRVIADDRRSGIERELERELGVGHVLAGKTVRAVAARFDQDDILFEVVGDGYAVVHLTWSGRRESEPAWPSTELFSSLQEFHDRRMMPDHDDYSGA